MAIRGPYHLIGNVHVLCVHVIELKLVENISNAAILFEYARHWLEFELSFQEHSSESFLDIGR